MQEDLGETGPAKHPHGLRLRVVRLLPEEHDGGVRAAIQSQTSRPCANGAAMRVILIGEDAFVELSGENTNYLVFIGSRKEAMEADNNTLQDMCQTALALAKYKSLDGKREIVH